MSDIRYGKLCWLIPACGLVMWSVACGVDSGPALRSQTQAIGPACAIGSPDAQWTSQPFVPQTGRFHVELVATPSASPIDAVIGLSQGPASWFPQLAAIVRFSPGGAIDVRAGADYRADAQVPYTAGAAYRFHVDIDVGRHVYSVAVDDPTGQSAQLARDYPFRTEQAEVGQLSNLAVQVDSDAGSISVCGLQVIPINTTCPLVEAGNGFVARRFGQPGEVLVSSEFVATPDEILDGVFGLSLGPATSFNGLAATVRLSPDGAIDARNGDHFQADVARAYVAGQPLRMRILANVATHTFSAFFALDDNSSTRFAQGYAFRTTQSTAGALDALNAIVDSPRGVVSLCEERHAISVGVRSLQDGNYDVALVPGGRALIATDATTRLVSASGQTLATLGDGGRIAADPAGNFYLARVVDADIVVDAYTADFLPRWTRSFHAGTGAKFAAIGADATSVTIAAGVAQLPGADHVTRILADGSAITSIQVTADAAAIIPNGYVLGLGRHNQGSITRWTFGNDAPDWKTLWLNSAKIDAMSVAPDGTVTFGGSFTGPVSFGGPTLPLPPGATSSVYVAALSATGAHLFSRDLGRFAMRGIASNGSIAAISTLVAVGAPKLTVIDGHTGDEIFGENGRFPFASRGDAGSVAIASSGRVYWNFAEAWPTATGPTYPYLVSLDPGI